MKTTIKIAILFIVANVYSQTPYPDQIRFKPFVIVKDSTQIEYGDFIGTMKWFGTMNGGILK